MAGVRAYPVRITYTEPAFQARIAGAPACYTIDYLIGHAASAREAERAALREWRYCAAHSGVGWGRFIQAIEVATVRPTIGAVDRTAFRINPAERRRSPA
jgi:hypothetical protein